jgi:hypothetical protein
MNAQRSLHLGATGIILLAAVVALVFTVPSASRPAPASAGTYYNCPNGAGAVLLSSGATCANLYPGCVYGGCPASCTYGSCTAACSVGAGAAGCPLSSCYTTGSALCSSYAQTYCEGVSATYGGPYSSGCPDYSCGVGFFPYGCTVRGSTGGGACAQTGVNGSPCASSSYGACATTGVNGSPCTTASPYSASAYGTSQCPTSLSLTQIQTCAGASGIIVCPGSGQLASATQGCPGSASYATTMAALNGPDQSNGSPASQNCAGAAVVATSAQCSGICPNGQELLPGTVCLPGSAGSSSTTAASTSGTATTAAVSNGPSVNIQPGWNLASFPAGTTVTGADSSYYALEPGDSGYETLSSISSAHSGEGYWIHFSSGTTVPLANVGAGSVTVQLPPGQFVTIGNPGDTPATVSGADEVLVYNQTAGYTQTTTLQPGQGAWAESASGGTVTITWSAPGLPS